MSNTGKLRMFEAEPDYEIRKRIIDTYDDFIGYKLPDVNPFYFSMEYPQRLDTLRHLVKHWILRATGNIPLYLDLVEEINALRPCEENDETAAVRWLSNELALLKPVTAEPNVLVIGLMVWGDYVKKMTEGLFKSWLAPGNFPALKHRVILHIITNKQEEIEAADSTKALKKLGIHFAYCDLPDKLLKWSDKYWLIGIGASLHLAFARASHSAFHHAFPDTIYADGYFASLSRLAVQHKNILMTTHRTDAELILKALEPYTTPEAIIIPPATLGAFTLNHIHLNSIFCKVNSAPHPNLLPCKYVLLWESPDKLFTASPHINPVYLSASTLAKLKDRYYVSLDSEMDFVITDGDFYVPQAEDGMCYVEVTGRHDGGQGDDRYVPLQQYPDIFWKAIMQHDTLKYFMKLGSIPIDRSIRTKSLPLPDNFIKAQHEMINQTILATDPFKNFGLKRKRLHER